MINMKNQSKKNCGKSKGKFQINFNQDNTSISVVNDTGYKLFQIQSVNKIDEIFCSDHVDTKIAERLFSSSLVANVWTSEQNKLKICHFKKRADICEFKYPKHVTSVTMNRSRLVVCLKDSIYIHNIRDMRLLHSIKNLPNNPTGICSLSLNCHLVYPLSNEKGMVQIFDAGSMKERGVIEAHSSKVAALTFSSAGALLATASVKGTVIRLFCVKNSQRIMEFRRGVKYAQIFFISFSTCNNFLSVSSNTGTIHIFKIDQKILGTIDRNQEKISSNGDSDRENELSPDESSWFSKAMKTINPLSNQDRAFANVQLAEAGMKYKSVVTKLEKEFRLMVACEDGFLYIYNLDQNGGDCKLVRAHDLRGSLYDFTELNGNESCDFLNAEVAEAKENIEKTIAPIAKSSYAQILAENSDSNGSYTENKINSKNDNENSLKTSSKMFDDVQFPPVC